MKISVLTEKVCARLVSIEEAIEVVELAFGAFDRGEIVLTPTVRGRGTSPDTRFGVKAGLNVSARLPGLKIGSYWPGNVARGLPNHGSTTVLLDDETGFPKALIAASYLNSLRTAAADAVAVRYLARSDASTMAVIGTGHQSYWQVKAVAAVRPISKVFVAGRDPIRAAALSAKLAAEGLRSEAMSIEEAIAQADIVTTITASRAPLFSEGCVRPGTHISAMGSDGPGKQELPVALLQHADIFVDWAQQSAEIGEVQHLVAVGDFDETRIQELGGLINGRIKRSVDSEVITVFDSSGIAIQDLMIADYVLQKARAQNVAFEIEL